MVKVKINEEACIGCGSCAAICPKTFEIKNQKAVVKKQPAKLTCEKEAVDSCPVDAISLN